MKTRRKSNKIKYNFSVTKLIKQRITNLDAFISIIKASVGTGCLEMPRAFCNAGWVTGYIGTYAIGLTMVYSISLLISSMRIVAQRYPQAFISYSTCLRLALAEGPLFLRKFSPIAEFVVNCFMCLYHFGVCCVYVLFIADNLKQLGDALFQSVSFNMYVIGLTSPLVLVFLIRSLKSLVPLSMLANILLITSFLFILFYTLEGLPPLSDRKMFNTWRKFPLFFGTVLFSMESVGVILAIENEMEKPEDYLGPTGILTLGSLVTLTIYSTFGFFGYWRFGCQTLGSITLNIPTEHLLSKLSKFFLALAIYISYALQGYVIVDILWNQYLSAEFNVEDHVIMEINTRCFIVLCTVIVAAISPDISVFLPFLGAFCLSILSFVLPGLIDLCVHYRIGYGPNNEVLFRDLFLIIFGILGCFAGTWATTLDLESDFAGEYNQSLLYYRSSLSYSNLI